MKHITTLFLLTSLPLLAHAQCDIPVPSSTTVIDTDGAHSVFGSQWVCSGLTVTLSSGFISALIEPYSDVTVNTNLGVFGVRANSTLTISGLNNNIYYDPNATIIDNGTNTMLTACPDLVFDYSDAPDDGCDLTAGIALHAEENVTVFPNPAHDRMNIQVQGEKLIGVSLLDMSGRSVRSVPMSLTTLDLSGLEPGNYMVELQLASGMARRPIVVY